MFRFTAWTILISFILYSILPSQAYAQTLLNLPTPGAMVPLSPVFEPVLIKGIKLNPQNPLQFDFIVDPADSGLKDEALKEESTRLIKYFLAALTVPEEDLWVNLSPYEKDRIIPEAFGQTEMGRDLLAQDYLLKQITASLMYPEDELGQKFWDRVYERAHQEYGITDIPADTFNKVWIVPEKAVVYENGDVAFVVESKLKVMLAVDYEAQRRSLAKSGLEQDYLARSSSLIAHGDPEHKGTGAQDHRNTGAQESRANSQELTPDSQTLTPVIRELLIPEIEKEVNTGKNFASLRQIYHSMILATWFKRNLKGSLLGQVYVGKNKVGGVDVEDKQIKLKIYDQYLAAFKTGVYDYIKEDYDPTTRQIIPRKYFSGGMVVGKELNNVLIEEQHPRQSFLKQIKSWTSKFVIMGAVLSSLNLAGEGFFHNPPLMAGSLQNSVQKKDILSNAREFVRQHIEYVLKEGTGIIPNDSPTIWKKLLQELKVKTNYPVDINPLLEDGQLLQAVIDLYVHLFNQATGITGDPYVNSLVNIQKMFELLEADKRLNLAVPSKMEAFFKGVFSDFIIAGANDPAEARLMGSYLVKWAEELSPRLGKMMTDLVSGLKQLDDAKRGKELLEKWKKINEEVLIPQKFYATLNIVHDLKSEQHYYIAVAYQIVDQQERYVLNKIPVQVLYGRKIDRTNIIGARGHSIEGEKVVFIDMDEIDKKVKEIEDTLKGNPYVLYQDEQGRLISHDSVTEWVRKTYGGKTSDQIREIIKYFIRAHELTHKALEFSGVEYLPDDRFGIPAGLWSELSGEDKNSITQEVAAYFGGGVAIEKDRGATYVHLLPHLFSGDPTPEYFAARYIFNITAGKINNWVDWRNPDEAIKLFEMFMKDFELYQKRSESIFKETFNLNPVQPFRFPAYIWSKLQAGLKELPDGIESYISSHGLAWTDAVGVQYWFDEDKEFIKRFGPATAERVWAAATLAVNEANRWGISSPKHIKNKQQLKDIIAFHEDVHSQLREDVSQEILINFQKQVRDVLNGGKPLTDDHFFIQAFKKIYGKLPNENGYRDQERIDWYIEEFLALSIQEAVKFNDPLAVLYRMMEEMEGDATGKQGSSINWTRLMEVVSEMKDVLTGVPRYKRLLVEGEIITIGNRSFKITSMVYSEYGGKLRHFALGYDISTKEPVVMKDLNSAQKPAVAQAVISLIYGQLELKTAARMISFGDVEGHTVLVTEYLPTKFEDFILASRLPDLNANLKSSISRALALGKDLLRLQENNLIHGDMQHHNVLLTESGEWKMIDFGDPGGVGDVQGVSSLLYAAATGRLLNLFFDEWKVINDGPTRRVSQLCHEINNVIPRELSQLVWDGLGMGENKVDLTGFIKLLEKIHSKLSWDEVKKEWLLSSDPAILSNRDTKGGIDLNPVGMNLETKGKGVDFDFTAIGLPCLDEDNDGRCEALDLEQIKQMDINGFSPVIIQMTPVVNLPLLLGVRETERAVPEQGGEPVSGEGLMYLYPAGQRDKDSQGRAS
ncbi:MAG: hypothetical protein A2Y04_00050 [Omnitrophica WOR_2 bacterium GWC2_45_7]|nr:MAG: hypothetical protein A2Z81_03875 [Omnitrophica WOR_2 bacterium GWA2_45_18]OGX18927.1 MAG: hypothetical protein A2Y04_00050 [Omnitrophica WOR_2 bacterium GWC2_45_7]